MYFWGQNYLIYQVLSNSKTEKCQFFDQPVFEINKISEFLPSKEQIICSLYMEVKYFPLYLYIEVIHILLHTVLKFVHGGEKSITFKTIKHRIVHLTETTAI